MSEDENNFENSTKCWFCELVLTKMKKCQRSLSFDG